MRIYRSFCTSLLGMLAAFALLPAASAQAGITRTQLGPNDEASDLVIVSPFRIEEDVEPGSDRTIRITLTNDTDAAVDVTVDPTDLEAASDPRAFITTVEDGEFGAGDWLVPEVTETRMQPWERLTFDLRVRPPLNAAVGTNFAGLTIDTGPATGKPGTGDQSGGAFRAQALIQVFLTVPGAVQHDLRVTDVDVRDSLVLGSQRFVVWDITYDNRGSVNEHVSGSLDIRSIFGNSAHRETLAESLVLRGSKRTDRVVWRDLPWVGSFAPDVRVRGDDAKLVRASGERVTVIPWWLPVLIVASFVLPAIFLWWRRRREWRLYLDADDEDAAHVDDYEGPGRPY